MKAKKSTPTKPRYHKYLFWAQVGVSMAVLVLAIAYSGYKTAIVTANNSDALIDNYMLSGVHVFHQALFPAAHTQLIKWPLFALTNVFGDARLAFIAMTIAMALLTYASFVFVLYKVAGKRYLPLLCLMLASVVVLTPAQLHGVDLPINLAMLTTRNLEYAVLFAYIFLVLRGIRGSRPAYIASAVLLAVLGASDKFFLMITPIAALIVTLMAFVRTTELRKLKREGWLLLNSVLGLIGGELIVLLIAKSGLTGIDTSKNLAPFTLVNSIQQLWQGVISSVQDTLINFGAFFFGQPVEAKVLPLLVNAAIATIALVVMWRLFFKGHQGLQKPESYNFGLLLSMMAVGAWLIFILSDHEFKVDERYIYLFVFAGFYAFAYLLRLKGKTLPLLTSAWVVMLLVVGCSFRLAHHQLTYTALNAQSRANAQFEPAADALAAHHVNVVVGNYWNVVPLRFYSSQPLTVAPLKKCVNQSSELTSRAWYQTDQSKKTRSALFLVRDGVEDTFNKDNCSQAELRHAFGRPAEQVVVRRSHNQPKILLWLYDRDIRGSIVK